MPLHPSTPRRERVLSFGGEGSGKTTQWCQWAAWCRRTKSPAQFYVLDSDGTVEAMADGWPDFYDNVTPFDVADWDDYRTYTKKAIDLSDPERHDVLVVDRGDLAWSAVQDYYVETVLEQDVEAYLINHAKGDSSGQHPLAGDWGMNWYYINKLYQNWFVPIMRFKGHVFITAAEQKLQIAQKPGDRGDDRDVISLYERLGVRSAGQKGLGHAVHTVLRSVNASQPRQPQWKITTVKDRQREMVSGLLVEDWVTNYLIPVAKWSLD